MTMIKIDNTTFNEQAVAEMGFDAFDKTYKDKLKISTAEAWKMITGKPPKKKADEQVVRKTENSSGEYEEAQKE